MDDATGPKSSYEANPGACPGELQVGLSKKLSFTPPMIQAIPFAGPLGAIHGNTI
jgi:hypothetical protein